MKTNKLQRTFTDAYAGNPFPVGHPKHMEHQESYKRESRERLEGRYLTGKQNNPRLRLADYENERYQTDIAARNTAAATTYGAPAGNGSRSASTRTAPLAPRPPVTEVVTDVRCEAECIAVIHGGATLWAGHKNGTITVRNGHTGDVAHTLTIEKGVKIESLFPTADDLMVIGLANGSVVVVDSLVMVNPVTFKEHKAPVPYFARLAEGSVVSASTDGTVVKWDDVYGGEDDGGIVGLEPVSRRKLGVTITSLACTGASVWVGDSNGLIHALDLDDMGVVSSFAAVKGPVKTFSYAYGQLFVAGEGGYIKVFHCAPPYTFLADVRHHEGAVPRGGCVSHLIPDTRAIRMWSIDSAGAMKSWDASAETDFAIRSTVQLSGGVVGAVANCHIDASRLWTIASNGINLVWWTEFQRSHNEMMTASGKMQELIEADTQQIARRKEAIEGMNVVNRRRAQLCVDAVGRLNSMGLARAFLWKWRQWYRIRQHVNRRRLIAEAVGSTCEAGLARIYFLRYVRYLQVRKLQRQRLSIGDNLLSTTDKGMRRLFFRKWIDFKDTRKASAKKVAAGAMILRTTENGLRRTVWRKWLIFAEKNRHRQKRVEVAQTLLRSCDQTLVRLYFFKMLHHRLLAQRDRKKQAVASALLRNTSMGLMRVCYTSLGRYAKHKRQIRQRGHWSDMLAQTTEKGLLSLYYGKMVHNWRRNQRAKVQKQHEEAQARHVALQAEYEKLQGRIEKQRALKQLQQTLKTIEDEHQQSKQQEAALQQRKAELLQKIENKKSAAAREQSVRNEFLATMAKLKSKALNFDADYTLIQKTVDKFKTVAVSKVFLQAHIEVKRVVVTAFGEPSGSTGLVWTSMGATPEAVMKACSTKMAGHQQSAVLNAIKVMVIAFDVMTAPDLDALESDDEIVANADNIIAMLNACLSKKDKAKK